MVGQPITYMAGSVPRYLRTTKLPSLPLTSILGSRATQGPDGSNFVYDIIMLPAPLFQRMRMNIGAQHAIAPNLQFGSGAFMPTFVLSDIKSFTVPPDIRDPDAYARGYFIKAFGLEKAAIEPE